MAFPTVRKPGGGAISLISVVRRRNTENKSQESPRVNIVATQKMACGAYSGMRENRHGGG
jgi:hypothetical protein